jgi:hypothetical protein
MGVRKTGEGARTGNTIAHQKPLLLLLLPKTHRTKKNEGKRATNTDTEEGKTLVGTEQKK